MYDFRAALLGFLILFSIPLGAFSQKVEFKVKVEFFNKKSVKGKFLFDSPYVRLNHEEKGILYTENLNLSNVEFIHPVTWFPEVNNVENTKKISYNFFPVEYVVKLKDGKYLNVVGRVKEFEIFDFVTDYGKSKIYTYFVDYLIFDKLGNAKWKNSGTSELNKNSKKPHPNVAYYIYFF
jgi:hypothetical protein